MTSLIPDPTNPQGSAIIDDERGTRLAAPAFFIADVADPAVPPTLAELRGGAHVGWLAQP